MALATRRIFFGAVIVIILAAGLLYLDNIDTGGSHQILLREKFSAIGSKLSASDFVTEQLDRYCFEPIVDHKEVREELHKDNRFYRNDLSDRAETGFFFLIFTGAGGPKYAMVRDMQVRWTNPDQERLPECWPLSLITIELVRSYRDGLSNRGVEEIGVVMTVNNQ